MNVRTDTYCGLYCGACKVFLANQKGLVKEIATEWQMAESDLRCNGCKSNVVATCSQECEIKACAEEKGIDFCFQCGDYPCKILNDLKNDDQPHHSIILHNLGLIKEKGIDKWFNDQKIRWSCPTCKEEYSWYEDECLNCGNFLKTCLDDEKEIEN